MIKVGTAPRMRSAAQLSWQMMDALEKIRRAALRMTSSAQVARREVHGFSARHNLALEEACNQFCIGAWKEQSVLHCSSMDGAGPFRNLAAEWPDRTEMQRKHRPEPRQSTYPEIVAKRQARARDR